MREESRKIALALGLLVFLYGEDHLALAESAGDACRTHVQMGKGERLLKRLVVLPPQVEMYELGAGGRTKMDDWMAKANQEIVSALRGVMTAREDLSVTVMAEEGLAPEIETNLDETNALFNLVAANILSHTYAPGGNERADGFFVHKLTNFDYSLGKEVQGLSPESDAFLLVRGVGQQVTGGRKALEITAMILGAAASKGRSSSGRMSQSGGAGTVALVDAHTGEVLRFCRMQGNYDFQDPAGAGTFASQALMLLAIPHGK